MSSSLSMQLTSDRFSSQPSDVRNFPTSDRDELIICEVRVDGKWVVKSRYGDDSWYLSGGTTNKTESEQRLNFGSIPGHFREFMKAVAYRYWRRGLEGSKKPGVASMLSLLSYCRPFLEHMRRVGVTRLSNVTPMICATYVSRSKAHRTGKSKSKPLASGTLEHRFGAVEKLFELSQFTSDKMPSHPWAGSSARHLAGLSGSPSGRAKDTKTPLIPDDVFVALFQRASTIVARGNHLLDVRDAMDRFEISNSGLPQSTFDRHRRIELAKCGWAESGVALNKALTDLRTACYIVIASLSGCRNHEMAYLQAGAWRSTTDDDGETYWWMRSRSDKTDEGITEWMIPEAAVSALKVMERWSHPHLLMLEQEIERLRAVDGADQNIAVASRHLHALFVGVSLQKKLQVRTLSTTGWNRALKAFASATGVSWDLASHQFRRKFANYAARSQFGDLRYLREHFKHWSMDMTIGYGLNDSQEMTLYLEVLDELEELKVGVVEGWLSAEEPLAGGYGQRLVDWRGKDDPITLFKGHKQMVKAIAKSTAIRSNGHAWCTADDNLCVGNDMEPTRCVGGCGNSVIGRRHAPLYQRLYEDLKEVATCEDIGKAGLARVRRDMERCKTTLERLGYGVHTGQVGSVA